MTLAEFFKWCVGIMAAICVPSILIGLQWLSFYGPEWVVCRGQDGNVMLGFGIILASTVVICVLVAVSVAAMCAAADDASERKKIR